MANIDLRTREGRAMKAAAEAARASQQSQQETAAPKPDTSSAEDHRVEPHSDEPTQVIERKNPAREQAMAEIEARALRNSGAAPAPAPEATPEAETSKPAAPADQSAEQPASPPISPDAAPVAAAPIETVRVKVDGEEFDAPKADVEEAGGLKAYQMQRAAENRLKKQADLLAETRRTQAQMAQWMQSLQPPATPAKTDVQFIQEKMDIIRFGTPEESAAAMKEVLARNNPTVDQNQIVSRAVMAMQQQLAEQNFVTEFSDIVHNPLLLKLIIGMKNERLAQLREAPDWSNFYRSIGNEVRGAIGRQSQPAKPDAATPSGTPSQPDKEARKASIVNLPTAAARAALPEATKPETREDVLNQLRKSRGIPTG